MVNRGQLDPGADKPTSWLIWFYPELAWYPTPAERWSALVRANHRGEMIFAAVLVIATGLLADPIEALLKHLFGLTGAISDLAAAGAFVVVMAVVFLGIAWFSRRQARRRLRLELSASGVPICVRCSYDLRGQLEPRCPECGTRVPEPTAAAGDSP